jgi:DNA modification methylase
VYDPFLGSGTALIAAERSGVACYAIEIDPIYIEVALRPRLVPRHDVSR